MEQKAAPGDAALLVVDVQNDFVADGGFFDLVGADVKRIQQSIPPLSKLIEHARGAGVLVVFIQAIYDPEYVSAPMRDRNRLAKRPVPRCLTGTWGADFHTVRPLPGEPVVIKHRYSGMIRTELDAVLKRHGIKSLLMTGVATDTCVEFYRARCLFHRLLRDAGRGLLRRRERRRPYRRLQALRPRLRAGGHRGGGDRDWSPATVASAGLRAAG